MSLLDLTPDEGDALSFVLDTTLERWAATKDTQIGYVADDPTLTLEQSMEVTGHMMDLSMLIKNVKTKLETST